MESTCRCMDCGKEIPQDGVCDECLSFEIDVKEDRLLDGSFPFDNDDIDFINGLLYNDPKLMKVR